MSSENLINYHQSIDWPLSIKLANNNKELAKDLLEMYITDLPRASESIVTAYQQKQYNELITQVHRLHGASCYCGVTRLKMLLGKMEFKLKEKLYDQLDELLREFTEEVNNALSAYKMVDFI
jgi:two-component system sensor histidine kinase BarA